MITLSSCPYCRNLKLFKPQVQKNVPVSSHSSIHRESKEVTKKPFKPQVQKDVPVSSRSSIHRESKEVTEIANIPLQSKLMRLTGEDNGRSEGTSNQLSSLSKYFLDSSLSHSIFNTHQILAFGLRDVLMNLSQVITQCFQHNLFTSSSRLLLKQRLEELSKGIGIRNREVYTIRCYSYRDK